LNDAVARPFNRVRGAYFRAGGRITVHADHGHSLGR
jgi:hypothetical protein